MSDKEENSASGSSSNEEKLCEKLLHYMNSKFDAIKRDLEQSTDKISKRLKTVPKHKFKKISNDKQFTFNNKVKEKNLTASEELDKCPHNIKKAKCALEEGKSAINYRNKLILIADTSDAGWACAEEYESKPFIDDSDDDKKFKKAEATA